MMANLVLSAFIIKSAVSAQIDYAKSTLGGTVSIQADMDTIRKNQEAEMKNIYTEKSVNLTVIGIYDSSEARANAKLADKVLTLRRGKFN